MKALLTIITFASLFVLTITAIVAAQNFQARLIGNVTDVGEAA
jgi:hypothetical protein